MSETKDLSVLADQGHWKVWKANRAAVKSGKNEKKKIQELPEGMKNQDGRLKYKPQDYAAYPEDE